MRLLAAALAVAAAIGVAGCITPSIPIPPPDPQRMTFDVDATGGTATFQYPPEQNYASAVVYVFNRERGVGIIETARPDGSVGPTRPVAAVVGDQIVVTFQRDDESISTCIRLRNGAQSATDYCNR